MGDLRPDNGGTLPPDDGGADRGLPDLPPDWGAIVIPDDPAELSTEAAALRHELRAQLRRARWRRLTHRPVHRGGSNSNLGTSLMIMGVAILTTLISLFVVTWDRRPAGQLPVTDSRTQPGAQPIGQVRLVTARGAAFTLDSFLPAVILLVDGCDCDALAIQTAEAAPAGVLVLAVDRTARTIANAPPNLRFLADPVFALRSGYAGPSQLPGRAAAMFVDAAGTIRATVPGPTSFAEIQPLLATIPAPTPTGS
jgi:hypothetical protein